MIDVSALPDALREKLDKLPAGHALEIRSYKRDRFVVIVKTSSAELTFIEDGFFQQTFTAPADKLRKELKGIVKREFPRSNKVRLYQLGPYCPSKAGLARKTI